MMRATGLWILALLFAQDSVGQQPKIEGRYAGPLSNYLPVRAEPVPRPQTWVGQQVPVGDDGRFTIGVPQGTYRVVVSEWRANGQPVIKATREVLVTDRGVTDLEILPDVNRALRVRLRRDQGAPVRGLVILNPRSMGRGPGMLQTGQAGDDGIVLFTDVAPDRYVLIAENLPERSYLKSVIADHRDVTATGLDLQNGQASEVELVVTEGGTVAGEVVDSKGKGVSKARVSFSMRGITQEEFQLRAKSIQTEENGRFRMTGLAPGLYTVGANADGLGPLHRPEVEVRAGAEAKVSVQLTAP